MKITRSRGKKPLVDHKSKVYYGHVNAGDDQGFKLSALDHDSNAWLVVTLTRSNAIDLLGFIAKELTKGKSETPGISTYLDVAAALEACAVRIRDNGL